MAELKLFMGCMFASKTEELIRQYNRYKLIGKNIIVIKPKIDVRYGNESITTHSNITINAFSVDGLLKFQFNHTREFEKADVIIIDEAQFFNDLEVAVCWVELRNKTVIMGGLSGDFKRKPFKAISDIIPYCDEVIHLSALCLKCGDGTRAKFTKRTVDIGEQTLIGGAEAYVSVCRKHYLNNE